MAIPHTKSPWVRHSSVSIARLPQPISWGADGGEVEMVIMLTLGESEGLSHVKVFSQLARKLMNTAFREALFAAENAPAILTLLQAELEL